jgi:hypothetical protein
MINPFKAGSLAELLLVCLTALAVSAIVGATTGLAVYCILK